MRLLPHKLRKILATAALTLFAAPIVACPTSDDMAKGVVFRTSDGNTELHRAVDGDWVQVRARFADGTEGLLDYYHGIYLATDTPIENGKPRRDKAERYASKANLRKWAAPVPQARWRNDTDEGGRASSTRLTSAKVGNCRFEAFDVTIDFNGERYQEVYLYLPALGTALLIESDDGQTRERYRYTAVGVLP